MWLVLIAVVCCAAATPLYLQPDAPLEERVQDLMSRMTLEEKVAQMLNPVAGHATAEYILGNYTKTGLGTLYTGIGGCSGGLSRWECQNYIQETIINGSRLHIPVSFIGETLTTGTAFATIFPQPVLLGASFNVELIAAVGKSIARQARMGGIDRGLSPVLQVDTDARFGRFEEAYGEDPYLVSVMGTAMAVALQGNTGGPDTYLDDNEHVSCEAKHALAYGYGGRDNYRAELSDRYLYNIYAKPWRTYLRNGGRGLMVAHPVVNGLPLHGSREILTNVLRNWFAAGDGDKVLIASDWDNIPSNAASGVVADISTAAMLAAWAGMDNEMTASQMAFPTLVDSVQKGLINVSYIDRAAANNLREKFATRLFDGAWKINTSAVPAELDTPADRQLAYTVAAEGIILLKNEHNVLPLQGLGTSIKKVALLGPLAGCTAGEKYPCLAQQGMIGHYVQNGANISMLDEAIAGDRAAGVSVTFVPGADINDHDESKIPAAVAAAVDADLTIIAVGDSVPISTGSCSENSDSDTIDLPGSQLALIAAVVQSTTKPVVVVLFNCRPTTFGAGPFSKYGANNALLNSLHSVLVAWRPGEAGANAVWDLLKGDINPSGRLTQNWVRGVGAVHGPASPYYQERGSSGAPYFDEPITPLFYFGYGLSYTAFSYSKLQLSPDPTRTTFAATDAFTVSGLIASKGPAARLSLLLFFSQNAPTKWASFNGALVAFNKFSVPANSAGTPFTITANVSNFDAYEPATKDYEVYTGTYRVWLATDAGAPPLAQWTVKVDGSYTWAWDFTK